MFLFWNFARFHDTLYKMDRGPVKTYEWVSTQTSRWRFFFFLFFEWGRVCLYSWSKFGDLAGRYCDVMCTWTPKNWSQSLEHFEDHHEDKNIYIQDVVLNPSIVTSSWFVLPVGELLSREKLNQEYLKAGRNGIRLGLGKCGRDLSSASSCNLSNWIALRCTRLLVAWFSM